MGNVGSRLDDSGNLYFKDQTKCKFLPTRRWYQMLAPLMVPIFVLVLVLVSFSIVINPIYAY